jgi:anti-sigma regulatory factor (Ser/Thr protein kinase)
MFLVTGITLPVARVARHPWYFETDSAHDALAGRHLLERYLDDHCEDRDFFAATLVFGELISNVIKHAPGGGVRVWLEPEGKRYALCINDAGGGFDDRAMENEPDDRSESGRGLYIVRQVCEDVSYSRRNGDGFLVRAVLPVTRR